MGEKRKNSRTGAVSPASTSRNVSGEKRAEIICRLAEIELFIQRARQDENTKNLLTYIADLKKDLRAKKFGLVFEEHREKIDDDLENNIPVLTEAQELFINNGGEINFLIEGDNLASLQLLEKTHKEKIDLIYIDPPYNTGKKDFVYGDTFVDLTDTFRHSKWLSFMSRRLPTAKQLLSKKGVIFISIDDNEQAQLKLMCDEVFGERNFIGCIIWQSATDNNPSQISTEHEYVLCYASNIELQDKWVIKSTKAQLIEDKYSELKKSYSDIPTIQKELRKWIKENKKILEGVAHYNNVDERGVYSNSANSSNTKPGGYTFDIIHPLTKKACPKPAYGWRWREDTFWDYEKKGDVEWGKDESTQPHIKKRINTVVDRLKSVYYEDGRVATKELEATFSEKKVFNNPKPTNLIKRFISLACGNSATVLDFFAGSGTTGLAVMDLNKEDDGKRRFILCTNNENDICRSVTYTRVRSAIKDEGYKASLKYFRVEFVPLTDRLYFEYADELLEHIRELVELENAVNFTSNARIAIILKDEELDAFASSLGETTECEAVYLAHDVLPSDEQRKLFNKKNIKINIIPNYYYKELSTS